jgi:hypothetical protein
MRTQTDDGELPRTNCSYPPPLGEKLRLSADPARGNLAGKADVRLANNMNALRNSREFESSPGHQIFLSFQFIKALSSGDFESSRTRLAREL